MQRLTDLREILQYVPRFQDRLFVIALDGSVLAHENFRNLLLDVRLLRSLRINVVLVHGCGHQLAQIAQEQSLTFSDLNGTGKTDPETLRWSIIASHQATHQLLEGLSTQNLTGVVANAILAHPAGILRGEHQQFTGRVERVQKAVLTTFLQQETIPIVPPLGWDGEGQTYRLNSDAVAAQVALALGAVKLIYLSSSPGILRDGSLVRQLTTEEARSLLEESSQERGSWRFSKLTHALCAAEQGIPRAHVIDGRVEEGLLGEVFSHEGVGTLIHANEYRSIRRANKSDVHVIQALIREGVANEEIMQRDRAELEAQIGDFFVFEVDGGLLGCAALHVYAEENQAELACVCVDARNENQGVGKKLIQYAEQQARQMKIRQLFCLSTQAYNYFLNKGGFRLAEPQALPKERRERYERSGRQSLVLIKDLSTPASENKGYVVGPPSEKLQAQEALAGSEGSGAEMPMK